MTLQIIKSESLNGSTIEAVTNGKQVAVFLIRNGESKQVSDWTNADSAAFIFSFVLSTVKLGLQ